MLTKGNAKVGQGIYVWNLPAGSLWSCPGASGACDASLRGGACYARPDTHKGTFGQAATRRMYATNWALVSGENQDCQTFCDSMVAFIGRLNANRRRCGVVRVHTSGDFHSAPYVDAWVRVADAHPDVRFFAYTRSWAVPSLVPALDNLRALPNFTVWASTDSTMAPAPNGWPEATIVGPRFRDTPPGYARCPEQTGRRASCSDCGLCYSPRLRPSAHLAFALHH
jgi:hypothetical protein